ncbi:hypothetical protein [Labrenzia sp. VG12]|uniref:glycosyltransferase n=1 Tax=Labrenzia sp. VG12 TaxID=2021862 RepID=UPI0012FDB0E2|nr:hypothetical protein [Labrenzia sp. VG12]
MSYQKFFAILKNATHTPPSSQDRIFLQLNAAKMLNHYAELGTTQKKQLVQILITFTKTNILQTRVFLRSLLFHMTGDNNYLKSAIEDYVKVEPGYVECINDYFALSNLTFLLPDLKHEEVITPDMLREIYRKAVKGIKERFPSQKPFQSNPSRIVVMLDQLLGQKHAPSNRAIKFTQILQDDFQKEVLLINTCMFSQLSSGHVTRKNTPTVSKSLSKTRHVVVDGSRINLFQPDPPTLSDESVQAVLNTIAEFGPSGILVVGNQCAIAEVFAKDCFTLCSPLNNDVVPECLEVSYHSHTSGAGGEEQTGGPEEEESRHLPLFQFEGPYDSPEQSAPVSRQELKLPENRPVIVIVGYRLGFEIDEDFLTMLEDIVSQSNAFVYFLGGYADYGYLESARPLLAQNSEHCEFQPDIMSVYEHCDLYLAPTRIGGGSSAVYAMTAGLPVLSVSYGDIQITTQHFPNLKNYKEVGEAALQILSCPDKMSEYKDFAHEGAKAVKDSKALMAEFLKHLDQFNEARAEALV